MTITWSIVSKATHPKHNIIKKNKYQLLLGVKGKILELAVIEML